MKTTIGKIKSIEKSDYKCIISFGKFGEIKGIPLRFENEPLVEDEVLCFIDDYESVAVYIPLKVLTVNDFVGIARSDYKLEFTEEGEIIITTASGAKMNFKDNKWIYNNNTTKLEIIEDTTKLIGPKINIEGTIEVNVKTPKLNIEGTNTVVKGNNIKIDGSIVTMTGGTLKTKGTAIPGLGPFNCIPFCPFSGAQHGSNTVVGT